MDVDANDAARALARASAPHVSVGYVLVLTTLMACASALGAVPYIATKNQRIPKSFAALANACACGVMLAASFDLIHEGQSSGAMSVAVGVVVGAVLIAKAQTWLSARDDGLSFLELRGADARKTLMIVGIMAAHAFGEGCGVGVSFSGAGGARQGRLVTLAIGAHNVPEGLAVANVLATRGVKPWQCAWWCVMTSLPQPLLAVPAFMFVETFKPMLPFSLGFAAGCMVWIVFAELLPDALADSSDPKHVATTVTLSAGALEVFRMIMEGVERYGEAGSAARDGAAVAASSAMDVGLAAAVYAPVGVLALIHVFPSMMSLSGLGSSTGIGIAASTAGTSAAFRLLWAVWRGAAGGAAFVFVVLGGFTSVLGGIWRCVGRVVYRVCATCARGAISTTTTRKTLTSRGACSLGDSATSFSPRKPSWRSWLPSASPSRTARMRRRQWFQTRGMRCYRPLCVRFFESALSC